MWLKNPPQKGRVIHAPKTGGIENWTLLIQSIDTVSGCNVDFAGDGPPSISAANQAKAGEPCALSA